MIHINKQIEIVLIISILAIFLAGCKASEKNIKLVADSMEKEYDKIKDFQYDYKQIGNQGNIKQAYKLYHKDSKLRLETDNFISDFSANKNYVYDKSSNSLCIGNFQGSLSSIKPDFLKELSGLVEQAAIEVEESILEGKSVYVVTIDPKKIINS